MHCDFNTQQPGREFPTASALSRRIRELSRKYDELDRRNADSPHRSRSAIDVLRVELDCLDEERFALQALVLATRATTLADAAAQIAHSFYVAGAFSDTGTSGKDAAEQVQRALASALLVVARSAGISIEDIGWSDLSAAVAEYVPLAEVQS